MTELHSGLPLPRRFFAIAAMFVGSMMLMIDVTIAGVVLPTIAKELHVENASTVVIVTTYQLILAMTMMSLAALGDRIGFRRLYQAGFILHCIAGVLCFYSNSLTALIAARALQALGTAAASSMSVALLREVYPISRLGAGLGLNTVANASGTALGPVLGSFVLASFNWHWVFVALLPLSIIVLSLSYVLPEPKPREHAFDVIGAVLCAFTFGLIIFGLESVIHSANKMWALLLIVAGLIVGWFFVRHERTETDPVLPIDLLTMPPIALSTAACFAATMSSFTLILFMPFRLQYGFGLNPGELGGLMSMYAVGSLCSAPASGLLSDRVPVALLSIIAMVVATLGLLFVAFLPAHPSHFDIGWRMWLCGTGFGIFGSPNARLMVAAAPPHRTASAGSIFTTTRMLSQATGSTLVAALLALGLGIGSVPALVAVGLALIAGAISVSSLKLSKRAVAKSA